MSNKTYINWLSIETHVTELSNQIRGYNFKNPNNQIKYIVGVARGGLIPAVMLSHILDMPMNTITVSFRDAKHITADEIPQWFKELKNVVVVDDISDSGETLKELKKANGDIKTAVIVQKGSSSFMADFFADSGVEEWQVFPWENDKVPSTIEQVVDIKSEFLESGLLLVKPPNELENLLKMKSHEVADVPLYSENSLDILK